MYVLCVHIFVINIEKTHTHTRTQRCIPVFIQPSQSTKLHSDGALCYNLRILAIHLFDRVVGHGCYVFIALNEHVLYAMSMRACVCAVDFFFLNKHSPAIQVN